MGVRARAHQDVSLKQRVANFGGRGAAAETEQESPALDIGNWSGAALAADDRGDVLYVLEQPISFDSIDDRLDESTGKRPSTKGGTEAARLHLRRNPIVGHQSGDGESRSQSLRGRKRAR